MEVPRMRRPRQGQQGENLKTRYVSQGNEELGDSMGPRATALPLGVHRLIEAPGVESAGAGGGRVIEKVLQGPSRGAAWGNSLRRMGKTDRNRNALQLFPDKFPLLKAALQGGRHWTASSPISAFSST